MATPVCVFASVCQRSAEQSDKNTRGGSEQRGLRARGASRRPWHQQQPEPGLQQTGADPLGALISDDSINSILLSSLSTLVFYSLINKQLNGN